MALISDNQWELSSGGVLKEALMRHPIQPEECWPAILGKKVIIRRGDMVMEPIIARDNHFAKVTDELWNMSEEKRLQTLCLSADLQTRVGKERGALVAVRINPVGGRKYISARPDSYEVVTYTLTGVQSSVQYN